MFFDPIYLLILIISMVLGFVAKSAINNAYKKYSKIATTRGLTGADTARLILNSNNINDVSINSVGGQLSDHYHPVKKQVNLSRNVYGSSSIAAVGISAHECGHAIQHHKGYSPIKVRNAILPIANIGNMLVWPLVIIGFIAQLPILINIGIIFFTVTVAFHFITLPIELDASRRAVKILESNDLLNQREIEGVKKVLNAAAFTYVASTLVAILNLIYLLILRNR